MIILKEKMIIIYFLKIYKRMFDLFKVICHHREYVKTGDDESFRNFIHFYVANAGLKHSLVTLWDKYKNDNHFDVKLGKLHETYLHLDSMKLFPQYNCSRIF